MPRTRSSIRLSGNLDDDATNDGTNITLADDSDAVVAKPTRGRPRKIQRTASRESTSSALTPQTNYSSGSEYATPLTSYVATPAAAGNSLEEPKRSARIEVVLNKAPPKPAVDSHKVLQQSIYSMKPKRKRDEIEDSEADYDSDNSPDALLARKLQEEEDAAALEPIASSSRPALRRSGRSAQLSGNPSLFDSDDDDEDDEFEVEPTPEKGTPGWKGKQRAVTTKVPVKSAPPKTTRARLGKTTPASGGVVPASTVSNTPAPSAIDPDEGMLAVDLLDRGTSEEADAFSSDGSVSEPEPDDDDSDASSSVPLATSAALRRVAANRRAFRAPQSTKRAGRDRQRLETHHPELLTMWKDLEDMPVLKAGKADQPKTITRQLKPFQLEGLAWMIAMEKTKWKGGLLGDEMGLGKTIQAVSLIMSDWPAKQPSLVLAPPVALMQWMSEIQSYTDGTLKTLLVHGTNAKSKNMTVKDIKKYDVIIMSYNSLESMYRKQEKGFKRGEGLYKEQSVIHQTQFHRVILDEAHSIKTRTTMTAKACFALKVDYRWCLSGTPLQNRIGEFFSLIRFLNVQPFSCYLCKQCPCKTMEWSMNDDNRCKKCKHSGMQHVSVFNQELLNPIQKFGNKGKGAEAFKKLRILTDRIMLRRLKKDHTNAMELPVKEIFVNRQFFGEEENDFAGSIMTSGQRRFDTYVAQGVLLNNYANIFGLIMQMRQVADHPDLILKKNSAGGQNVLVCCICDEPAEEAIRSKCKHDFCRTCAKSYLLSSEQPDCPRCHIPLSIDLEQPEIEQDEDQVRKSSIINRIKMENWTSSSKIELLVHELHKLRSNNATHKSIIFSQFTTMLQLIEWRLRRAGITTVMLDGSMTPAQRQASIEHFMKNVNVECFLVSLKAGGVALNLTEASRVYIVDP
ncbi:SNF2 family N-terminal domain-containing protein [Coniochaeta sp. 2T2.1]|nr:SNF2 family N-terminal domain-containing protein [Coniochaeta sp. 2T2.1]